MHSPTKAEIKKWRRHLASERQEAATYSYLAGKRTGVEREVLLKLAKAEQRHEQYWLDKLGLHAYPAPIPPLRTRIMATLARTFGSVFVLALAQSAEERQAASEPETPAQISADERVHSEVVRALAGRSRMRMAGTFRAAVFGMNDGLVSNLALLLGVAAAGVSGFTILLTGFSGLLAGALSMGAGEYVSVRSQRELLEASNPSPAAAEAVPELDLESNELALVFRARGMEPEEAEERARKMVTQIEAARLAEETQTDGFEEVGDGWKAALSSFLFFSAGAIIPIIPFLLPLSHGAAMVAAVCLVGVALLITGGFVGLLSGARPAPRALRQLAIGLGAAAVTFVIGTLTGS